MLGKRWPYLAMLAFSCTAWSSLANLSPRVGWGALRVKEKRVSLVAEVCRVALQRAWHFVADQPGAARSSWYYDKAVARLWRRPDVWVARAGQCAWRPTRPHL